MMSQQPERGADQPQPPPPKDLAELVQVRRRGR
jgi:hypothetical protein